jgi:hypothetical protein
MAEVGTATVFASTGLTMAKGTRHWFVPLMFAGRLDAYFGQRLLAGWLQKGPVRDAIDLAIVGEMLKGSIDGVRAARAGAKAVSSTAKAVAKPAVKANLPLLAPLFPIIDPLKQTGFTVLAASEVASSVEHFAKRGTDGLLSTTTGRAALLGAIDGACTLGSLWLPDGTPLQLAADVVSSVAMLAGLVNGKGWLDGILGGDPPTAKAH